MSCQAASDPDAACLEQLLKVKSILCEEDVHAAHSLAVEQSVLTPGTWLLRDGRDLPRSRTNAVIGHLAITPLAEKLSPTAQLTFRVASGCARYPTAHEIPGNHIPLSSIPQVHWTGFRDYTTAKDRAVLSMLLARSGTARPWGHIAFALGLPHEFSRYPPLLIRQIKRSGDWTDTLDQIENQTRELLTGPPPIDYHRRRLQLANPDLTISIARILSTSRTFRAVTPHALAVAIWESTPAGPPSSRQNRSTLRIPTTAISARRATWYASSGPQSDQTACCLTWDSARSHLNGAHLEGATCRQDTPATDLTRARQWLRECPHSTAERLRRISTCAAQMSTRRMSHTDATGSKESGNSTH